MRVDSKIKSKLAHIVEKTPDTRISPPCVIAEAGVNHEGQMKIAKSLIFDAAAGGANAIKFQTYRADTIASKNSPAYWDITKESTSSQHALFKKYDKFWKTEFEQLKVWCDDAEIEFLSTPFDKASAEFLNDLMGVFKISSSDITNKPFIEYLTGFGKPIILSTGASDINEIDRALSWIDGKGVSTALLHCILNYPTSDCDANLAMIGDLKSRYPERVIGYSDHTLPKDMRTLETAWLLGAAIIEKHFTHDKTLPGNDHYHAMDKQDLIQFKANLKRIKELLGEENKRSLESEAPARLYARRSLVAACGIKSGSRITPDLLTWKRPGHGISPADIDQVLKKKACVDISEDEVLTWEKLS